VLNNHFLGASQVSQILLRKLSLIVA